MTLSLFKDSRQNGFSLASTMTALVLALICLMATYKALNIIQLLSNQNLLRQKAIFVAQGAIARLAALYQHADFPNLTLSSSNFETSIGGYSNLPSIRSIYFRELPGTIVTQNIITESYSQFISNPEMVFLSSPAGSFSSGLQRNAVHLDFDRGVTADLTWSLEKVGNDCYQPSENCSRLTVILTYPFLRDDQTQNPYTQNLINTDLVMLQTIVGRR